MGLAHSFHMDILLRAIHLLTLIRTVLQQTPFFVTWLSQPASE